MKGSTQRVIAVIALCLATSYVVMRVQDGAGLAASGVPEISDEQRAATLTFAPGVVPDDRAWILAAIATARPEAQQLIGEVDGLIEVRTDLADGMAVALAQMQGDQATINLDVRALDGDRIIDRNVAVLHELGHIVDFLLVDDATIRTLDAGIPTQGECAPGSPEGIGACTAVEERFAETFAKWALSGRVSIAGDGYGILTPASLEDWGAPLGLLAAKLSVAARG
jgi:hypothetical protein